MKYRDSVVVPGHRLAMGLSAGEAAALVRAGATLGLTAERLSDELLQHPIDLATFQIERAPVTCEQYQAFVDGRGYEEMDLFPELIDDFGPQWRSMLAVFVDETGRPGPATWRNGQHPPGHEHHPVHGVSLYEAAACARFFDARLPTEAEWEGTARHPDGRHFPWGNELPTREVAGFGWNRTGGTTAVGSHPAGTSALGLVDLAGNVHEWTASRYEAYRGGTQRQRFAGTRRARVARGGSYTSGLWDLRTTSRFAVEAQLRFPGLGLRLVTEVGGR